MSTAPKNESPKAKETEFSWQPFLMDVGIQVAKGLLIGASMSLGGIIVNRAFAPRVGNKILTLIPGGGQKVG